MGSQLRHRQTKGAATVARSPTVTAPHLDSTYPVLFCQWTARDADRLDLQGFPGFLRGH